MGKELLHKINKYNEQVNKYNNNILNQKFNRERFDELDSIRASLLKEINKNDNLSIVELKQNSVYYWYDPLQQYNIDTIRKMYKKLIYTPIPYHLISNNSNLPKNIINIYESDVTFEALYYISKEVNSIQEDIRCCFNEHPFSTTIIEKNKEGKYIVKKDDKNKYILLEDNNHNIYIVKKPSSDQLNNNIANIVETYFGNKNVINTTILKHLMLHSPHIFFNETLTNKISDNTLLFIQESLQNYSNLDVLVPFTKGMQHLSYLCSFLNAIVLYKLHRKDIDEIYFNSIRKANECGSIIEFIKASIPSKSVSKDLFHIFFNKTGIEKLSYKYDYVKDGNKIKITPFIKPENNDVQLIFNNTFVDSSKSFCKSLKDEKKYKHLINSRFKFCTLSNDKIEWESYVNILLTVKNFKP